MEKTYTCVAMWLSEELQFPLYCLFLFNSGEMAQPAKGIAAKPDGLSSSPEAHLVERENQLPQADTLTPTCVLWYVCYDGCPPK